MILKQNCYILSSAEKKQVLSGNYYKNHTKVDTETGELSHQITYSGSSLFRYKNKNTKIDLFNTTTGQKDIFRIAWKRDLTKKREHLKKRREECKNLLLPHTMSTRTRVKITNKLIAWAQCIPKYQALKFTFTTITLTSEQIGSYCCVETKKVFYDDKAFTKMLNTLFTFLRKMKICPITGKCLGFLRYMYVLERQENGNIHAHLIASQFMPPVTNKIWCKILGDNGYTFPQINYQTGALNHIAPKSALKQYQKALYYNSCLSGMGDYCELATKKEFKTCVYGGQSDIKTHKTYYPKRVLNGVSPVDFSTVQDLKSITRYITKYITKNKSEIFTNTWNCSHWVSIRVTVRILTLRNTFGIFKH